MAGFDALDAALALLKDPVSARGLHRTALPEGIPVLLAVAIGDEEVLAAAERRTGRARDVLLEAASFYVEQSLLSPSSDSYRVLGGTRASTHDELRRNMALLMRWLHPDLQALRGTAAAANREVFSTRVTSAWGDLKSDERRETYDRQHPAAAPTPAAATAPKTAARPAAKPTAKPAPKAAASAARKEKRAAAATAKDAGKAPKRSAGRKRAPKPAPEDVSIPLSDAASRPLFDPQPIVRREHRRPRALGLRRIEGASLWVRLLTLFRGAT